VRYVDSSPVPSEGGWTTWWTITVELKQVEDSPGSSERVLGSQMYKYRRAAANATKEEEAKRLDVKRGARWRAKLKFDPVKSEAARKRCCRKTSPGQESPAVMQRAAATDSAGLLATSVPPSSSLTCGRSLSRAYSILICSN
jgi:hypothetical protein